MTVDTEAIRRLMERLRSTAEMECETAIGHLLEQADVGVFERAADELDDLRVEIEARDKFIASLRAGTDRDTGILVAAAAIHFSHRNWRESGNQDEYQDVCNECGQLWPCRTMRILQGRPDAPLAGKP